MPKLALNRKPQNPNPKTQQISSDGDPRATSPKCRSQNLYLFQDRVRVPAWKTVEVHAWITCEKAGQMKKAP